MTAALLAAGGVAAVLPSGPDGRIVAVTAAGQFVTSSDRGTNVRPIPLLAGPGLIISVDGQYVATGTGNVLRLTGGQLVATGRSVSLKGPPGSWQAFDFADHDRALVAAENRDPSVEDRAIEVVTFDGRSTNLGMAVDAAGDPQAPGVFAVTGGPGAIFGGEFGSVNGASAVELVDAGARPRVLARSARVSAALHLPPSTPLLMSVAPDPAGDKVAVGVSALGPSSGDGIVVLSRGGRLLGAVRTPAGSLEHSSWSPDGTRLVYNAATGARPAVAVWRIGRRPSVRTARVVAGVPGTNFGNCLWADGSSVVCADGNAGEASMTWWVVGPAGGGPLVVARGPALPLGWVEEQP